MPLGETYLPLEGNVVDGAGSPSVGIREDGWDKQLEYVVEPGSYTVPNPFLVNMAAWNKLPQKLKDLLRDPTVKAEKKVVAEFDALARKERPILVKEDIQVIDLPPAEKEKFLKIAYDAGWRDVIQKKPQTPAPCKKNCFQRANRQHRGVKTPLSESVYFRGFPAFQHDPMLVFSVGLCP